LTRSNIDYVAVIGDLTDTYIFLRESPELFIPPAKA
jgi:hypothetical protein